MNNIALRGDAGRVAVDENPMADLRQMLNLGVALGQQNAFGLIAGRCSAAQAETLRRIREEKLYVKCAPVWKDFCPEFLGMSSSHADRIIALMDEFGPKYFSLAQLTRISAETYRAIEPAVKDGTLRCNGEIIELAPENARKIAAAVAELRKETGTPKQRSTAEAPSLPDLARRFDEVLKEARRVARDGKADRLPVIQTLQEMLHRLAAILQETIA